jgi:hypothetical protein
MYRIMAIVHNHSILYGKYILPVFIIYVKIKFKLKFRFDSLNVVKVAHFSPSNKPNIH